MATAPKNIPQAGWTSVVVVFAHDAALALIEAVVKRISAYKGVTKIMPVSRSANPILSRTFYMQIEEGVDSFMVIHRVLDIECVTSATIHKCPKNSHRIKKADEPLS